MQSVDTTCEKRTNALQQFVKTNYAIDAYIKNIPSYQDLNFIVLDKACNKYILKLYHPCVPIDTIKAQVKALEFLKTHSLDFATPHPLANTKSNFLLKVKTDDKIYTALLLSYIEGQFISQSKSSDTLIYNWGRAMAQLDNALTQFNHRGCHHENNWDFKSISKHINRTPFVKDVETRNIIEYHFDTFIHTTWQKLNGLRQSVIHNDGNENNLLQHKDQIIGIIDFGDLSHSYLIGELAISATYAMLISQSPLAALSHVVKGYHDTNPLFEDEIELLLSLIKTRLSLSVTLSSMQAEKFPGNEYILISQKPAITLLKQLQQINPQKIDALLSKTCHFPTGKLNEISQASKLRGRYIAPSLSLSYQKPLEIIQGSFQYLYDTNGDCYLDCVNNIAHVGHCHPRISAKAAKQIRCLNTNTRYLHESIGLLGEKLIEKFPPELDTIFFVCSGSEANELALRLAKNYTQGCQLMVLEGAYHGNTSSLIDISPYKHENIDDMPSWVHVAPLITSTNGQDVTTHIKKTLSLIESIDQKLIGFIAESILSCAGQISLPQGFLSNVYDAIRVKGGLCIADEVQTGFGRIGSHYFAFEQHEVIPDIVTLGKPMGNGHPIAAVVTKENIAHAFLQQSEYFNSFGGNPVSCISALEVMNIIDEQALQQNAAARGKQLLQGLKQLKERYHVIGDIRGSGLFMGIEIVDKASNPCRKTCQIIVEAMKKNHILLSQDGINYNVIKIKPPLCINHLDIERVLHQFEQVLACLFPK
jgi:4-aminobutyrate aminotransferase-like enzyme/Ser/Thr protein kinase RdoA (MazF antagonist)